MKRLLESSARADILRQYEYYLDQDVVHIADRFLSAVETSIRQLLEMPGLGAPHFSANPRLAGLRSWHVNEFDDIRIYYLADDDTIKIIRILHGKRDIGPIFDSTERFV